MLVPAYNEPEVVADLIGAMAALEYPADKLQVLLLLEADDDVTIDAAKACAESDDDHDRARAARRAAHQTQGMQLRACTSPPARSSPSTTPRTCQSRCSCAGWWRAFRQLPDDVACVQAKLVYHNGHQNMLTAWFTAEYGLWFGYLLPGHDAHALADPVGRHVESPASRRPRQDRRAGIRSTSPRTPTSGLRIAATGYHTAVLDSTTLEEANSDPINWIRQRSRWYKGYLQTWLVHMRRPVKLFRTIGLRSFVRFNLVLAGTPIIAVLNLLFWLITVLVVPGPARRRRRRIPLVHLLSCAGLPDTRQRRHAVHEPDRAARRRPVRSAVRRR